MIENRLEERIFDLKRIDFYKLFTYFFICAFIGWIYETGAVFLLTGQLTDRGLFFVQKKFSVYFNFLNNIPYVRSIPLIWGLPLIEIYGFGGCIIVLGIGKIRINMWHLFFISILGLSFFELVSSYFCEFVLHQTYWDYSTEFMNFQGRICLRSSLVWGGLAVMSIKYLKPKLERIYEKERQLRHYKLVIIILSIYTGICILFKSFVFT